MKLKKFRVEIVVAIAMVVLYLAVARFYSTPTLTREEVDAYIARLEAGLPREMEDRAELINRLRSWGYADDGEPIYMLNLMRLHETLRPFAGGPTTGTPAEANAHYEDATTMMLVSRGGGLPFAGNKSGVFGADRKESNLIVYKNELDNWDRLLVVRYPGRRTFLDLVSDPEYLKVMPYKLASLEVVLTPFESELMLPDYRLMAGAFGVMVVLLVGWIRAAGRARAATVA